jgi:hypothetical protein
MKPPKRSSGYTPTRCPHCGLFNQSPLHEHGGEVLATVDCVHCGKQASVPYEPEKWKGIEYNKEKQKWRARIHCNRVHSFLGYYDSPEEAARVRDQADLILRGGDAKQVLDGKLPEGATLVKIAGMLADQGAI